MFVKATVSKKNRWRIDLKINFGEIEERQRKEFGLNEIEDIHVRTLVADRICDFLENFDFTKMIPTTTSIAAGVEVVPTIAEKLAEILQSKLSYDRANTRKTYQTAINKLLAWCEKNKLSKLPWNKFGPAEAKKYIAHLRSTGVAARTMNNNLTLIRTVFTEMAEGDQTVINPFSLQKRERIMGKNRRIFTDQERRIVADYIEKHDYWLFRGILLQYFCYVRPVELSRLKFKAFDLAKGIVVIRAYESKVWKERVVTIPDSIMPYFRDGIFDKQPGGYYLFGKVGNGSGRNADKMAPSTTAARVDRPYKKHRFYLEKLAQSGSLKNIEGLTWYSWKDTGITRHVEHTTPMATRDQAGHSKFDMTLVYYKQREVNKEYHALLDDLKD